MEQLNSRQTPNQDITLETITEEQLIEIGNFWGHSARVWFHSMLVYEQRYGKDAPTDSTVLNQIARELYSQTH